MVTGTRATRNYAVRQAERRRAGEAIPGVVTMEVTYRCNLKCLHCYLGPYTYGKEAPGGELSTSEVTGILDQLFKAGTFMVDFTGGEVLCRPDIFEIFEYTRKIGLFFGIKTNATLITEPVADRLKELGIAGVHVSLYGATPASHEFVTRVAGSYEKTIRAVKLLRERRIRARFNTTIMKCNVKEHQKIEDLGKTLGVKNNFDPFLLSKVDQPGSAADIRINDEDLKNLIIEREWVPDDELVAKSRLESHLLCVAGKRRCAISPLGEVFPCTSWRIFLGDLRRQSFTDIWQGEAVRRIRSITVEDLPTCARCEMVKYCARCPGMIQMENENGGISGPSSVNCRIARAIKEVRDANGKENLC